MFQAINSFMPFDVEEPNNSNQGGANGLSASAHVGYQPLPGAPGQTVNQQGYSDGQWREQSRLRHFFGLG